MQSAIAGRRPRRSKSARQTIGLRRLSLPAGTLHFLPMRIHSIEVARASQAYGLRLTHRTPTATSVSRPSPTTRAPDQLIAASVNRPVSFEAHTPARAIPKAALQLYTRAADKLEAATAIQVGRSIDLTG